MRQLGGDLHHLGRDFACVLGMGRRRAKDERHEYRGG
jgi:hypothetical protein